MLEEQARRHHKIVEEMVLEAGEGFIAKTGDSTRAALIETASSLKMIRHWVAESKFDKLDRFWSA